MTKISRFASDFLNSFSPINFNGKIGSYGDVVFITTPFNVLTPHSGSISYGSKVTEHENLGEVSTTEFLHRNLRKVNLGIKLIYTKCNVLDSINKLKAITENGEYYPLILGGIPLSNYGFSLLNFNVNIKSVGRNGNIEIADCNLELQEYIPELKRALLNIKSNNFGDNSKLQFNERIDNSSVLLSKEKNQKYKEILNNEFDDDELIKLSNAEKNN